MLIIGRCFLVFDGLDEVLTDSNRAKVTKEIREFAGKFVLSPILVTSRYVGYDNNRLSSFTHFGVSKLDDPTIGEIYKSVSISVLRKTSKQTEISLQAFMEEAKRKASELIRNPLLLTLIVIIHFKKREIPDNRADLYDACAELLFERWDSYRDIEPELPERYRLYDLLMHLSSILFEREALGGRITKTDLEKEAKKFFRNDYIDNKEGRAAHAARHMINHLTGRAWILHEVGENIFEFTHRTFLEFFFARHLEAKHESVEELIERIRLWLIEGDRTLPAHLALQVKSRDKRLERFQPDRVRFGGSKTR